MTIIDDRDAPRYVVHAAGFPPVPAPVSPRNRYRRQAILGWLVIALFLTAFAMAMLFLGSPDASAAGGCGGG